MQSQGLVPGELVNRPRVDYNEYIARLLGRRQSLWRGTLNQLAPNPLEAALECDRNGVAPVVSGVVVVATADETVGKMTGRG